MKTTNAGKRIRSTVPPLIRAAVMTANIIWKTMTADAGTRRWVRPGRGCPIPCRPASPRFPMRPPPASLPKARLKPNTAQITVTSPMQKKLCIITARTPFERTIPP